MTIKEMHVLFRVLGQQSGLQLVRGILPEAIDAYLNTAIYQKVRTELLSSVIVGLENTFNKEGTTMDNINLYRSLFRHATYNLSSNTEKHINMINRNDGNMFEIIIPTKTAKEHNLFGDNTVLDENEYYINPMMYLNFSIKYKGKDKYYGCRLIPADTIQTVNRDYCNKATVDEPIVTLYSLPYLDENKIESNNLSSKDIIRLTVGNNVELDNIGIDYIKNPNQVKYDINEVDSVDCDLPNYVHAEIVQSAVTIFQQSIGAITQQQV